MRTVSILIVSCLLGACSSTPRAGGEHWFKPWTWGSTSEARRAETAEAHKDVAREAVLLGAQASAHKTQDALAIAADSQAVIVARDFSAETVALLDQAKGPSMLDDLTKWQAEVSGLCSSDVVVRTKAEAARSVEREATDKLSEKLADTEKKLDAANKALPEAERREAETANKYRQLIWGFWGLVVIAVLVSACLVYVKYALGGIPAAMGKGLALLRAKNPEAGSLATQIFDGLLDQHEQQTVSKHA